MSERSVREVHLHGGACLPNMFCLDPQRRTLNADAIGQTQHSKLFIHSTSVRTQSSSNFSEA